MSYELPVIVKEQLIGLLNHNIRLEEATLIQPPQAAPVNQNLPTNAGQTGAQQNVNIPGPGGGVQSFGGSGVKVAGDKVDFSPTGILLGSQPNIDLGGALGMAALGKGIGGANRLMTGKLGQAFSNVAGGAAQKLLGGIPGAIGGQLGAMGGAALQGLVGNVGDQLETLSGAPWIESQLKNIAPQQMALRWQGAGAPGWFSAITPNVESQFQQPKTVQQKAAEEEGEDESLARKVKAFETKKKAYDYGIIR